MVSSRLKNIFTASIPIFVAHEAEEFATGFWKVDPLTAYIANLFPDRNMAVFTIFNVEFLIIMIAIAMALRSAKWQLRMFTVFGFLYLFELSHITRLLSEFEYYPGMVTAFISLIVGLFFWRELIRNWKEVV